MTDLRDHLTAIRDEFGTLTAELVVEAATPDDHPLHSRFEWDDTVAGRKYRLSQAGELLRVVKLPSDPARGHDLRAFVAIKGKDTPRAEYVPTEEALADEFTRRLVLADMSREWRALKKRYEHMQEFADLVLRDLHQDSA